ncbi:ethanolamine utilization protein EutJ [Tepidanaerobacter sp. GT38]|uniref:ethanolamine utilization protein EutJ n=1 Tax=Tepidanaerobacter sp. GT38 TaxID=2722793 RepID=UPI001F02D204|nr:ethanolamine utilization protein EutJ [Tepidanaerobacter sp. GT38]MCG1013016.1 ethanolamine utilization protein EutJ [Tepidanaerobacter sp. GT38]
MCLSEVKSGEKLCEAFWDCLNGRIFHGSGNYRIGVDLGTANVVVAVVDDEDNPVAGKIERAEVVRDGIVVDFVKARNIVENMIQELEHELRTDLQYGACAVPPGTAAGDFRATRHVVESAGIEVLDVFEEPVAAAKVLGMEDQAIVDIGGGTTGISIIKSGEIIYTADEPTGGVHFTLVIAGNYGLDFDRAEELKLDSSNHRKLLPVVKPVMEKVATIIHRHIKGYDVEKICLVGGTSSFEGLKDVIEQVTGIPVYVPKHCILVTPLGIALSCRKGGI